MGLFSLIDGRESFTDPNKSIEIRSFYYHTRATENSITPDYSEWRLGVLLGSLSLRNTDGIIAKSSYESWQANERNTLNGIWSKAVFRHNSETCLFGVVITTRTGSTPIPKQRVAFLEFDNNAPYHELVIELTQHPLASTKKVFFEGRFNVLSTEEINTRFSQVAATGSTIRARAKNTCNLLSDSGDIVYTLTQKDAGRKAVAVATKTVTTKSGVTANVAVGRARRINIKK